MQDELKQKMEKVSDETIEKIKNHIAANVCNELYWDESVHAEIETQLMVLNIAYDWRWEVRSYYMSYNDETIEQIMLCCQMVINADAENEIVVEIINYLNREADIHYFLDHYELKDGVIYKKPRHNRELLESIAELKNDKLDEIVKSWLKIGATLGEKEAQLVILYQCFIEHHDLKSEKSDVPNVELYKDYLQRINDLKHKARKEAKGKKTITPLTEDEAQMAFDFGLAFAKYLILRKK